MDIPAYGQQPGVGTLVQTGQTAVVAGRDSDNLRATVAIAAATVDAGASPTTNLRAGLVLGRITATGLYTHWSPAATDGSEVALLVLAEEMSTLDATGTAAIKEAHVWVKAILQAAQLSSLTSVSRRQLQNSGRYIFDDDLGAGVAQGVMQREIDKAANYTVVAADAGTLFTASAAATFTLPTIAAGLGPFEFLNISDANMAVSSAEGENVLVDGNATADGVIFSTASHKIGGRCRFRANAAGTKWYVENLSAAAAVMTVVDA